MSGKPSTKGGKGGAAKASSSTPQQQQQQAPAPTAAEKDVELATYSTSSKPDRDVYNQEQEAIKAQIAGKQAQLEKVRARISDSTGAGSGPLAEQRKALRSEQQELRQKTSGHKLERNEVLNQLKALNESVGKKIKDVNIAKSKTSYKSVAEIDQRIQEIEKQVESGQMRLVDEKRALSEISELRRSRRTFDAFSNTQGSIDEDKAKIEELRTKLDNPEFKELQSRYEAIQAELDAINADLDKTSQSRDKLFEERNKLQDEVNQLWSKKKESAASFKDANDKYYTRVNDERAKRIERQQAERRAYEDSKRKEINEQALEEARLPAYGREIEDCTTLINYFSRFASGASAVPEPTLKTAPSDAASAPAGVAKLELRKVEDEVPTGAVLMKKKGQDDDNFFVGGKGKKGGKKGGANGVAKEASAASGSSALNVNFQTVAALLQFNIPAPLSRDDVPKTIDALKEKKSYFESNNDRVTKERIAAAEERIRKAEEKSAASGSGQKDDEATADAVEDATEGVGKLDVGSGGNAE